jgi:hypothetical protein
MICTAHYNYSDGEINKNEMGVACGTYGGEDRCLQSFGEETLYKRPLERSRRRWKYVIIMGLHDVGCVVMYWTALVQDWVMERDFVNAAMNLRVT